MVRARIDGTNIEGPAFLNDLIGLDLKLLALGREPERRKTTARLLLLHRKNFPFSECVASETVHINEVVRKPLIAGDGFYVRIEYEFPEPTPAEMAKHMTSDVGSIPERKATAYAGYLFDQNRVLIVAHVDRPL